MPREHRLCVDAMANELHGAHVGGDDVHTTGLACRLVVRTHGAENRLFQYMCNSYDCTSWTMSTDLTEIWPLKPAEGNLDMHHFPVRLGHSNDTKGGRG